MHCRCIDRGCSTIADAVNIIEQYECIIGSSPIHSSVRAVDDVHRSNKIEQQLNQIQVRLDQIEHTAKPISQKSLTVLCLLLMQGYVLGVKVQITCGEMIPTMLTASKHTLILIRETGSM